MRKALCAALFLVASTLLGCGGGGSQSNHSSGPATVSSIQVAPTSMSIGTGSGQQFTATAQMSDGTSKDITNTVQWSSSDSSIASGVVWRDGHRLGGGNRQHHGSVR
jgi:hypothetical protein